MFERNPWLAPVYEYTVVHSKDLPTVSIGKNCLLDCSISHQEIPCIDRPSALPYTWSVQLFSSFPDEEPDVLQEEEKKHYRTKGQAGQVAKMPKTLAIITQKDYRYALTFKSDEHAYLQLASDPDKMQFVDGKLARFGNMPSERLDMKLYCTNDGISDFDIPQLLALYSIIWHDLEKKTPELLMDGSEAKFIGHSIKMYLPDFLRLLGKTPNQSKDDIALAIEKIRSYSSVMGIIEDRECGRVYRSIYTAMVFHGYDERENTIYFASPYLNMIIMRVLKASVKRDEKGNPMINKAQQQILLPCHSYLIKSELAKERNKRAAELVCAIVTLIERCGRHEPHILAENLVTRCPGLQQALDNAKTSSDKNKVLKRAFGGAWKLLPKHTELKKYYKDIELPTTIPTMATLDTLVFTFNHNGKTRKKEPAKC